MTGQSIPSSTITFLGTGGARVVVANQILASGGMWMNLGGTEILVDPGPGCITQSTKRKLKGEKLSAIILSHRHLDHSGDINIMVEAMTKSGFTKRGWLFAPSDALGNEPVLFSYLKDYLDGIGTLKEGGTYSVGNVSFSTPVRHIHSVETYGILFEAGVHTFAYITDTRYFEGLNRSYASDLLIINVVFLEEGKPFDHLSIPDVRRIINEVKPRMAILTHFGTSVWRAKPWEIARKMSEESGVKVIAARDGMKFDLSQLDEGEK